ncbi:MAG: type II toxin-antitoxin system VapC family toxin [Acidobacteria bacterium]|nr:type II toxin-antitoxin system VapC family toxin [Acidobacteriota bacterium]
MKLHLDTSVLIDALTGPAPTPDPIEKRIRAGDRLFISTLVLFEWLRGPRTDAERALRVSLFPDPQLVVFGLEEATRAAGLYRSLLRPRQREVDIAIAACAIEHGAALWTLNPEDFKDIPGLTLYPG